jgi:hypothetical protein
VIAKRVPIVFEDNHDLIVGTAYFNGDANVIDIELNDSGLVGLLKEEIRYISIGLPSQSPGSHLTLSIQ